MWQNATLQNSLGIYSLPFHHKKNEHEKKKSECHPWNISLQHWQFTSQKVLGAYEPLISASKTLLECLMLFNCFYSSESRHSRTTFGRDLPCIPGRNSEEPPCLVWIRLFQKREEVGERNKIYRCVSCNLAIIRSGLLAFWDARHNQETCRAKFSFRVWKKVFVEMQSQNICQLHFGNDSVTNMPLTWRLFNYFMLIILWGGIISELAVGHENLISGRKLFSVLGSLLCVRFSTSSWCLWHVVSWYNDLSPLHFIQKNPYSSLQCILELCIWAGFLNHVYLFNPMVSWLCCKQLRKKHKS